MRLMRSLGSVASLIASLVVAIGVSQSSAAVTTRPYTVTTLPNGLQVIGMETHKVPLVTIVLAARAGAMTETADISGLTHLWEHMFFKGNARLPDQEAFNKRLRQLGITFNGDTAAEKVRYFITLPSVFLDDGLQFMADAIASPLLDQKELERERHVVLDEYDRAASHPSFDLGNLERNMIFGEQEHRRNPLGLRPIIETATREQLLRIKQEVFAPSNMALLIAGDFKSSELTALAAKHFGAWKAPANWQPVKQPEFPAFPASTSFVMTRPNVQNANVSLHFAGPKTATQAKDTYAVDVLVNLLEHRSGRFYRKFIDSGLTYEASLGYYTQAQAGEIDISATTEPKRAVAVQADLLAEISAWAKPGYFDAGMLADVKRKLTINHKRELNQPTEYIKTLGFWWAVTGLEYYDSYLDHMQQVTLEDVQAFVRNWLIGKPHIDVIFMSPSDAKLAGIPDTSGPLVEKYLSKYRRPKGTEPSKS